MGQRSIVISVSVSTQTQALRLIIVRVIKCLYVRTHICLCVCMCLSVRDHIFGTTRPIFTKFLCVLPMVVARSSSGGVVIHYVLPVLWMASRAESAVYDCLVVLTVYSITSKCAM